MQSPMRKRVSSCPLTLSAPLTRVSRSGNVVGRGTELTNSSVTETPPAEPAETPKTRFERLESRISKLNGFYM